MMDVDKEGEEKNKVYESREYQTLLLEEAKKDNVILYLPTGSGKTYIAQMLIRHFGHELVKPISEGGKRSFFLCTTQALLYQQGRVLQKTLEYSVGYFSGADAVDYWTESTWQQVFEKYQVIAFTAQILLNLLSTNRIQFRQISVLIFDECHHVEAAHAMKQITDLYANQYRAGLCTTRLMGLTATLLNSDVKGKMLNKSDLHKQVLDLERAFCGRVISSDTEEVTRFSTNPDEEFQFYTRSEPHYLVVKLLNEMRPYFEIFQEDSLKQFLSALQSADAVAPRVMECGDIAFPIVKKPNVLKDLKQMHDEVVFQMENHGLNAGNITTLIMMLASLREIQSAPLPLVAHLLECALTSFTVMRNKAERILEAHPKSDRYLRYNSHKIDVFLRLLQNYNEDQRTLVFCHRRATVKMLYNILRKLSLHTPGYEKMKPDFLVGVSTHLVQNTKLAEFSKREDQKVLGNFNMGKTNVLVATDVLEEGIDIQSCNVVIKFDPPQHTRSYVQSKGRARSRGSKYILMISEKDRGTYLEQHRNFAKIEETLKEISHQKRLKRDVFDNNYQRLPGDKPPRIFYVDGLESASVSEVAAPSLLSYYFQTLQYDTFSTIAPQILKMNNNKGEIKVVLRMPINCPLYEDIHGDWIHSGEERIKLAFQDASFKACIKLHEMGELTNELRPINRYEDPSKDKDWFPNYTQLDTIEDPSATVGRSQRKEIYNIVSIACLEGSPKGSMPLFLHSITLKPQFLPNLVNTERKKTYTEFLASGQGYGIITSKPISRIVDFPLYERLGEMNVSISVNTSVTLSQDEIKQLHKFHIYLFRQVVPDSVKNFMVPSDFTENTNDNILVVPLQPQSQGQGYTINWSLVNHCQNLSIVTREGPNVNERKAAQLRPQDYYHRVIIPWYRNTALQCKPYIVTDISPLTSSAPFPDSTLTYSRYYEEKYDVTLYHKNQFMLEVKPVTSTQNKRLRKDEVTEFEETLLPELCNLVDFPAPYWIAALFLPSILYRMTALLAAEQLRVKLGLHFKLVSAQNLTKDGSYAPLCRANEAHLVGKKRTYNPMDPHCKARSDIIQKLQAKRVDKLSLDLEELKIDEELLSDLNEGLDPDLYKKLSAWNLDKDLDEVTIFDVVLNEKRLSRVNAPLFTKATQAGSVFKKVDYKPYDLAFEESVPAIDLLTIKYEQETCLGPSQREIYECLTAHSVNDVVNYERLETLGDSFLKFASTLTLYTSLKEMDEGRLTLVKGTLVGNKNLYLAARALGIPSYVKIHEFAPLHDWIPPRFCVPPDLMTVFKDAELPPSILLDIDLTGEVLVNGKISKASEEKIYEFICSQDHESLEPQDSNTSNSKTMASSFYNFFNKINLGDKVVADVVEALTGVYLRTTGIEGGMIFLQALDVLPKSKVDIRKSLYSQQNTALRSPEAKGFNPLRFLPKCEDLEKRIQYTFRDKTFLLEALSHPSYIANRITQSYQRLEFLGDAILDFLVTAYLFENYVNLSPGDISDIRSAMVNNVTFASYAVRIGLHKVLLYDSPRLHESLTSFAQRQEARNHEINDEILFLIEENDVGSGASPDLANRVAEHVDVPKALGDVFEALIGAVYIDSGKDLEQVWYLVYNIMKKELAEWTRNIPKNHKRLLHELQCYPEFGNAETLSGRCLIPLTVTIGRNRKSFYGVGLNKKKAALAAAKVALRYVE